MPLTIADFWKLLIDSRLITAKHCQQLQLEFARSEQGATANDPHAISSWLVNAKILSPYQSTILLNGHSGPFFYGDYRIQDRITGGRFDGYFQATHQPTAHPVLLQFLSGDEYQQPLYWQQFVSFVQAQSLITSPTLQGVHEVLDAGDFRLVAYEDLGAGQTAAQVLANDGRLTAEDTCRLAWSVVHALYQLQQAGVAFGFVCPANLWIGSGGHLHLIRDCTRQSESLDFKQLDQDLPLQAMIDYIAPELVAGQQQCNVLSDMYALGCTYYELLSGRPPFPGPQLSDKIQQHAAQPIQPLDSLGVPQSLFQLVTYLMAKNPQLRYQNYGDLLQKLATQVNPADQNIPTPQSLKTETSYLAFTQQRQATVAAKATANAAATAVTSALTPQSQGPTGAMVQAVTVTAKASGTDPAAAKKSLSRVSATSHNKPKDQAWWQSSAIIWLASALGVLILTTLIVLNLPDKTTEIAGKGVDDSPHTSDPETSGNGNDDKTADKQTNGNKSPKKKDDGLTQTVVDDPLGELLWASPTQGSPFKLTWVPPAGQLFMLIRPADLLGSEPGQLTLDALGPTFARYRSQWEKDAAVELADIDTLVMTLHDNDEAFPRPSFVIQLTAPREQDQLLAAWGNPQATKSEDDTYFKGNKWCFYIPTDGNNRTFVMGIEEDVREVANSPSAIAPLRRELAELLKTTDTSRHFTLLFAPNFLSSNLFRDGRELFFGNAEKLRQPLEWLIGEEVKAGLLSLHVKQHFYLEARLFGGLGKDKFGMARGLRERMSEIPRQIEEYFAILNPPPYWRLVANRYPMMIQQLHKQTRIGVEHGHAMINIAMQPEAAHNLLLGGELCLSSTPGAGPVAVVPNKSGPKDIHELLLQKFSVDIPQQDLEFAVKDIITDVRETFSSLPFDFDIKIIGPELKLEGITRNQAVRDFIEKDKPLSEILTGIVSKANPDPSVKDPSQLTQKLVWVIADDPDKAGSQIILITTRKDAEEEKYSLPKPFQPK